MRTRFRVAIGLTISYISISTAQAGISPLGVGILSPVQFPPQDFTITGARISALWSNHKNVYGLDVGGIGNITETNFGGMALAGGFNYNKGATVITGFQIAGLANVNVNKARIVGVQAALGLNSNSAESSLVGLQVGLANNSPHTAVYGFQVGAYNRARDVYGFQIGLVNVADSLHGVQIGILNFNRTGLFSVAPFLNIGF